MDNNTQKWERTFTLAAVIGLWFLGLVLVTGIFSGFFNIWWWLAFIAVLVLDFAFISVSKRLRTLNGHETHASTTDPMKRQFLQVVSTVGGVGFLGIVLYMGIALHGFFNIWWWLAFIAVLVLDFALIAVNRRLRV